MSSHDAPPVQPGRAVDRPAAARWRMLIPPVLLAALIGIAGLATGARAGDDKIVVAQSEPDRAPATETPDEDPEDEHDQEASLLYDEALEEFELGDMKAARRRLEMILSKHPSTRVAGEAYQLLRQVAAFDGLPLPPAPGIGGPEDKSRQGGNRSPPAPRSLSELEEDFKLIGGDRVFFGDSSFEIDERAARILDQKAAWLARNTKWRVVIEGHADDRGGPEFNSAMAARRAEAVRRHLVEKGVDVNRLRIESLGERRPVATCKGPQCSAHNRRVVLVLTDAAGTRVGSLDAARQQGATNEPSAPRREGGTRQ